MNAFQKAATRTLFVVSLAGAAALTASAAKAATYVDAVTKSGKCFTTQTSVYAGKNQYRVNGRIVSFTIKSADEHLRRKKNATYNDAIRIGTTKIGPQMVRSLKSKVATPIARLSNVVAARVRVSGNSDSVLRNFSGYSIAGKASASFVNCTKVDSLNRKDGNPYGTKGFGKNLDPFVRALQ